MGLFALLFASSELILAFLDEAQGTLRTCCPAWEFNFFYEAKIQVVAAFGARPVGYWIRIQKSQNNRQ